MPSTNGISPYSRSKRCRKPLNLKGMRASRISNSLEVDVLVSAEEVCESAPGMSHV